MLLRLFNEIFRSRKKTAEAPGVSKQPHDAQGRPEAPEAWLRRGLSLEQSGNVAAALECYRACAAAHPGELQARLAVTNTLSTLWRMEECLAAYAEAAEIATPADGVYSGFLLFTHYAAAPDARTLFELHRQYGRLIASAVPARAGKRHLNSPDPGRPLRIGYVSRNFSRHSIGYFIEPVIAHHDRSHCLPYCYYTNPYSDETTKRIVQLAHAWREVERDDDDSLAARIIDDRIDILVDLDGHANANRLGVFARKPAPVQATWLGYPDTTGIPAIDYRITDALADPQPEADARYTERLLRVDAPFLCYQPPRDSPPVTLRDAAAPAVFGSFNLLAKVNEPTLDRWAGILRAVPGSRILLKSNMLDHRGATARLLERFQARGIGADRVDVRGWTSDRTQHLELYGEVDVALDTFPYNGTTTTCEALWMGVPVVTLAGDLHMSRVGATLLTSVGLQDLVAESPEDYVRIAVELASDAARLRALRTGMRSRLAASALLDGRRFATRLENEFRRSWKAWCAAQAAG